MPTNADWPAFFYAPHQDDEALGMAGAIAEHKDVGRPVYLVLLTDGRPSERMQAILNGDQQCPIHHETHHFNLTIDQMIWARTVEFVASAHALGVDRVFLAGGGGYEDGEAANDYDAFRARVRDTIKQYEALYPGASHKLISGVRDTFLSGEGNPTHAACWDAASDLQGTISDFRFYRVYIYDRPKSQRTAPYTRHLSSSWLARKRAALNEYKRYDPGAGRYAYGYHSVHTLFDAAYADDTEYVDRFE
jgi:LmbE family N-acetylglucosaminyl deacetylase